MTESTQTYGQAYTTQQEPSVGELLKSAFTGRSEEQTTKERIDTGTTTYGTGTSATTVEPSFTDRIKSVFTGRSAEEQAAYDRSQQQAGTTTGTTGREYTSGTETGTEPTTGERMKSTFTGRTPEEQAAYDRSREYGTSTAAGTGTGTGREYSSTGGTEPTTGERIKSAFTGRSAEEQAAYDRSREHGTTGREYGTQAGTSTTTGYGATAGHGYGTSGSGTEPTTGERMKSAFTGRSAEEQAAYNRSRSQPSQYGTSTSQGRDYGTTTGTEPSVSERMKSTFTGRSAEEQAAYDRSREHGTAGTGTGTGTGTGREYTSEREYGAQPTTGERIKSAFTGRTAEEQAAYDRDRDRDRSQGQGRTAEYEYAHGYGTEPSATEQAKAVFIRRAPEEQTAYDRSREYGTAAGTTAAGHGRGYAREPTTGERMKSTFTGRTAEEQAAYDRDRSREHGTTAGTAGGTTGYGREYGTSGREYTSETGTEPSMTDRIKSVFTGRTAEEQAAYDRAHERGGGYTSGTYPSTSERTKPSMMGHPTSYGRSTTGKEIEEYKTEEPTTWQSVKGVMMGRSGTEQAQREHQQERQREYEQAREREREHGTGTVRPYGTSTGTGTGRTTTSTGHGRGEQPSIIERIESTFTGRTPEEQHLHDERVRREREMEKAQRGYSRGLGGGYGGEGILGSLGFGTTSTHHGYGKSQRSFGERMKESIDDIRQALHDAFDFRGDSDSSVPRRRTSDITRGRYAGGYGSSSTSQYQHPQYQHQYQYERAPTTTTGTTTGTGIGEERSYGYGSGAGHGTTPGYIQSAHHARTGTAY